MFGKRRTPSARPSLLMFRFDRQNARLRSSLVLYQVRNSDYVCTGDVPVSLTASGGKRSMTAAVVWQLARSWRMMGRTKREFRRRFPGCSVSCRNTTLNLVKRFNGTGSVNDRKSQLQCVMNVGQYFEQILWGREYRMFKILYDMVS